MAEWKGATNQPGCGLMVFRPDRGYHQSACLEADVGSLHHYRWSGGVDNNLPKTMWSLQSTVTMTIILLLYNDDYNVASAKK